LKFLAYYIKKGMKMICTLLFPPLMMFNLTLGKDEYIVTKQCVKNNRVYTVDISKYRGVVVDLVYDKYLMRMSVEDAKQNKRK